MPAKAKQLPPAPPPPFGPRDDSLMPELNAPDRLAAQRNTPAFREELARLKQMRLAAEKRTRPPQMLAKDGEPLVNKLL